MEATTQQKQQYLREEIMPNYDPQQFAQFLESDLKIPLLDVQQLTMETLKDIVLKFKQYKFYQKQQNIQTDKSKDNNGRGNKIEYEKIVNGICTLYDYQFQDRIKCLQIQPFTKYLEVYLPRVDVVQTQGMFFGIGSKKQIWFVVKTNMEKNPVKRLQEDFQWLSATITKLYPTQAIPQLIEGVKDKEGSFQKRRKELQEYLQILASRQQMKRSNLLYQFLTFPSQKMIKMKKNYDSMSFVKALHSVKTSSGQIKLNLTNKLRNYSQNTTDFLRKVPKIHQNISQSIEKVSLSIQQTTKQLYKIVDYFAQLHEQYSSVTNKYPQFKINQYNQTLININNLIHIFANDLLTRSKTLNTNLKQYSKIEINYDRSIFKLCKNICDAQKEYLQFKNKLNKKKEKLYPDVTKWEVQEKLIQNRRINKEQAFQMMLPRQTKVQNDLKKWLAYLYTNYKGQFQNYLLFSVKRYCQVYCTFCSQLLLNDKTYVEQLTKFIQESQKLIKE